MLTNPTIGDKVCDSHPAIRDGHRIAIITGISIATITLEFSDRYESNRYQKRDRYLYLIKDLSPLEKVIYAITE